MFTMPLIDAHRQVRLRFVEGEGGAAGGAPAAGAAGDEPVENNDQPSADKGFPANTPVEQMTDAQQAAYWKFHSRKHEDAAKAGRTELDKANQKITELEHDKLSDADKALAEAQEKGRVEGRREAAKQAASIYLLHKTGKSDEDINAALDLIDVTKLTQDDGTLDIPKLEGLANTLGVTPDGAGGNGGTPPADVIRTAVERANGDSAHRGVGSINELVKQRVAELSPSQK